MNNSRKICILRKQCEECPKEYGRKKMVSGSGVGCLQSLQSFEDSHTCSKECSRKRAAKINRARADDEREERERLAAGLTRAINTFLYPKKAWT